MAENKFTWVTTHKEIVEQILAKRNKQQDLIQILIDLDISGLHDEYIKGKREQLKEIDPFTFFCFLYKHGSKKRLDLLQKVALKLKLSVPEDDYGIPSVNAQKVCLFPFGYARNNNEIDRLWDFFISALENKISNKQFADVLTIKGMGKTKITEGLFNILPDKFFPLNQPTKPYIEEKFGINSNFKSFDDYISILNKIKQKTELSFYELSYEAWKSKENDTKSNYWIFQGNPKQFDFEKALREDRLKDWTVSAHKTKINEGDKVIIWITGKKAGCYALAEVIQKPHQIEADENDQDKEMNSKKSLKAGIKITHNFADAPILKYQIKGIKGLQNLKVGNQGSNFTANELQYNALIDILNSRNSKLNTDNKHGFEQWLIKKYGDTTGTPSSYIAAINYLSDYLNKNIFEQSDIVYLNKLYEETRKNQRENEGKFYNANYPSYGARGFYSASIKSYIQYLLSEVKQGHMNISRNLSILPKPFLLLAGISGTGKTRFVREQAKASAELFGLSECENYCLVSVRPDWHEPSDLLGYVSRIKGTQYIATDFLKFTVKAMVQAIDKVEEGIIYWKSINQIAPYWLCLDEMNLAPVEQYFAEYLSVLETIERNTEYEKYKSQPILKANVLQQLAHNNTADNNNSLDNLWNELFSGIECSSKNELCEYFLENGIPIPPNLIVAGTVNMDETTHGFSRKVIDRALTIDFQEFFPNDYDMFLEEDESKKPQPVALSFPLHSFARKEHLPKIDDDIDNGDKSKSVEFLKSINTILKDTPFELAYRALNELLLAVIANDPKDEIQLQSVWDDFIMQKVLPRIEGDQQKLRYNGVTQEGNNNKDVLSAAIYGKDTVLHELYQTLANEMSVIWENQRVDLLRTGDKDILIECRSEKKLKWMMKRLKATHFTDFWV